MNQEIVTYTISALALLGHIGLIIVLISYFLLKDRCDWFWKFLGKNGIFFAFLVSLASLLGSLYYSDIVGLEPCSLCWYARIFMYPIVFLTGLSLLKKKDKSIIPYGVLLASIGILINIYNIYLQIPKESSVTCSPFATVSCSEIYFITFGYITFPVLSLTAFIMIIMALLFSKKHD